MNIIVAPKSEKLIEQAVALVGEHHRDTILIAYRLGFLDGKIDGANGALSVIVNHKVPA